MHDFLAALQEDHGAAQHVPPATPLAIGIGPPPSRTRLRVRPAAAPADPRSKKIKRSTCPSGSQAASIPDGLVARLRSSEVDDECRAGMPLAPFVSSLALANRAGEMDVEDSAGRRAASYYLGLSADPHVLGTKENLACRLQCRRQDLHKYVCVLANLCVHVDRICRFALEKSVVSRLRKDDLLCYVIGPASDETPMPISLISPTSNSASGDPMDAPPPGATRLYQSSLAAVPSSSKREKTTAKLLQSDDVFDWLVRLPSGGFLAVGGFVVPWAQHLERNTGECLQQAEMERNSCHPSTANAFCFLGRAAARDRAGANLRYDPSFMLHMGGRWRACPMECEVHVQAKNNTKVASLIPDIISGQINFTLSINFGAGLQRMHAVVKAVVKRLAVIVRTAPSVEAENFRRRLLQMSLRDGARLTEKCSL